ncbi:NFX1-type zinc finger-containing protein 1 [Desmophyllum pertusum]|uniref:NFX1-type zinc finger-containing protein 1 n=1 Tax=Desmophyllum pertusum TaxID=174260 RepID=A0A9X0D3C5_9CNID|nr:NFX1-type zinc finger-containing protein 1 [Desmophyllum pertusum]
MRPEIAALTKRIYEHEIVDHESVCKFDDISGLKHNMFFIDHCQPEILVGGLQSFSNPHEAGFLVALCRYLLLQGYKQEQITILTMYTGQLLELKNKMPRSEFQGIKICVVDNFQGEENDIILLSLVRSNIKIGFLKDSNRICVALSRARQGFYCIGNFTLLKSQCMLWKEICDDLETTKAIGQTLALVCKRHSNVNEVKHWSDFQNFPLGGCDKVCGERLDCGHACDRACHSTDEYHEQGQCPKPCLTSCPNEHQCQKRCHHPRDCFCARPMMKTIPRCGHEQTMRCCIDPETFLCQVKCEKTLDCEHRCDDRSQSFSDCNSDCNKVLDCDHPCSKKCKERCHCNTTIEVELLCKHRVRVLCPKKGQLPRCIEKCRRELDCGHDCPGLCHEECSTYRCKRLVEKLLSMWPSTNHPCHFDPRKTICQEMCQKKCDRGHSCQRLCHFGLPCKDCKVVVSMTIPSCKHNIEMPCSLDPAALVCKKPCERVRICEHPCRDVCGKDCEARSCMKLCTRNVTMQAYSSSSLLQKSQNVQMQDKRCGRSAMWTQEAHGLLCCKRWLTKCAVQRESRERIALQAQSHSSLSHKTRRIQVQEESGRQNDMSTYKVCYLLYCDGWNTRVILHGYDDTNIAIHKKRVECSQGRKGLEDEKCDAMVKKILSCGHEKEMKCFVKPEEVLCDVLCERVLSCEHPCRGRCSDDCSKFKCAVRVEKNLACGHHKLSCLCFEDVSQIICPNKCKRKLPCGHNCPGKCSEECSDYKCEEMVMKKLQCQDKHPRRMPCYKDPTAVVCWKRCKRKTRLWSPLYRGLWSTMRNCEVYAKDRNDISVRPQRIAFMFPEKNRYLQSTVSASKELMRTSLQRMVW